MSSEQGFLDALTADPGDDVTRLVYADWLEENGDPRGAYLRTELELATLGDDDAAFAAIDQQVREGCGAIDVDWLSVAGRRWDVWLIGFTHVLKISAIKLVRAVIGCGLYEAKMLVESVPTCLLGNTHRAEAEEFRKRLTEYDSPAMAVLLRPAPVPSSAPRTYQPPPFREAYLQGPRPGQKDELMRALEQFFKWTSPRTASLVLAEYLPYKLGQYQTEALAQAAVESLEEYGLIELRRIDRPAVTKAPFLVRTPATPSKGEYEVRLLSYPADRKIAVIRAYRELTGCSLVDAKYWSEQTPPLVVVVGTDKDGAEGLRNKFADLGAIEVREGGSRL